jgi:GT2 family glycosyltransferase
MPTAVLDLDFQRLPDSISGLEGYTQALALIRFNGRPVGQALLPVAEGAVTGNLRDEVLYGVDSAFWEEWLNDYLDWKRDPVREGVDVGATVAICTRDRPKDLQRCLDALKRLPEDGHEILVVDNCPSTEATRRLASTYDGVRYVRENQPGLNVARNRALREATHEIVAFSDDDAAPDPGWLRALLRNFDDPRILCVTGLTMPMELETQAQEWFQRMGGLGRGFKRMIFDAATHHPLKAWQAGAGVNMALRKSALRDIGPFDEALDVGTPSRGGGDTEMFARILSRGYRIVYDPRALSWHRHRSQWKELRVQLYGYELSGFAVWTRTFLFEGDWGALEQIYVWVRREMRGLITSLWKRPGSAPLDLLLARFCGAAMGPWVYLYSRWLSRRRRNRWRNDSNPSSV